MRASRRGWLDNRVRNNATKIYVDCIVSSREVERVSRNFEIRRWLKIEGRDAFEFFRSTREKRELARRRELVCICPLADTTQRGGAENATRRNIISINPTLFPFQGGERNHSGIEYHLHFCPFFRNYIQRIQPPLRFMECKLSTILFPLGWALVTRAGLFHKLMENR